MSLFDDIRAKAPRDFRDAVTKSFILRTIGSGGLSRAEMVEAIEKGDFTPEDGMLYTDGLVSYVGSTGATAIPNLPGLLPFGVLAPEHFNAVGDYYPPLDTGTDDSAAIQAALEYARDNNRAFVGKRNYDIKTTTIGIRPDPDVNYYDGSTRLRPQTIRFENSIRYRGTDVAIDYDSQNDAGGGTGGDVLGPDLFIGALIGNGISTVGTPGGSDENIGLRMTGAVGRINIKSVSGFNFGILFDGCWQAQINLDVGFECREVIYSRTGAINGYNNNKCRLNIGRVGGAYITGNPADSNRVNNSSEIGIHLDNARGFSVWGVSQYSAMGASAGFNVKLGKNCSGSQIYIYTEGAGSDGDSDDIQLYCEGTYNHLWIDALGSPTPHNISAHVKGFGNHLHTWGDQSHASSVAFLAPTNTNGMIIVEPGNYCDGYPPIVPAHSSPHNLNKSSTTVTSSGLTLVTGSNTPPGVNDPTSIGAGSWASATLTGASSATGYVQFDSGTIAGHPIDFVKHVWWLRLPSGEVRNAQYAIYHLDSSGDAVTYGLHDGMFGKLDASKAGIWQRVEFFTSIPTDNEFTWRLALRNPNDEGGTGFEVEVAWPYSTFDIYDPVFHSPLALEDSGPCVLAASPYLINPIRSREVTVSDTAASISTGRAECVRITGNASAATIQGFANLIPNTSFVFINDSGTTVTIGTNAVKGAGFTLADGEFATFRVLSDGSTLVADR